MHSLADYLESALRCLRRIGTQDADAKRDIKLAIDELNRAKQALAKAVEQLRS